MAADGRCLHNQQTRSIFNRNVPPPFVNDIVTLALSTIKRYTPRDPVSRLMLFNLTSVRAMFTLVLVFMLLNHTSIRAMFILVSEIVIIHILILIQKLPIFQQYLSL